MKTLPKDGRVQSAERPVLLILDTGFASNAAMLRGIFHHQKTQQMWMPLLADTANLEGLALLLQQQKWRGVISAHITPSLVLACTSLKIPLIDLHDSAPQPGTLKIRPDNVAIGHLGAEHFIERRFRKFAFCGFSDQGWSKERCEGFEESLNLAGWKCIVHEIAYPGESSDWDEQQIRLLSEWINGLPRGCAVMAANDMRALQLLRAATKVGCRVPEEFAVLGVNNDKVWCELADPTLSSVAPNFFEAGFCAAEQMNSLLGGRKVNRYDIRIEPAGLAERLSTVPAPQDSKVAASVEYIRENACRGITVEEVVAQVHASRSQMESRFRRFLGRSPQAEIRRIQMERMRQLLSTTELSLKEIAERTGFVHVEYMCVVFKRLAGQTMGQYRRSMRAQEKHLAQG